VNFIVFSLFLKLKSRKDQKNAEKSSDNVTYYSRNTSVCVQSVIIKNILNSAYQAIRKIVKEI